MQIFLKIMFLDVKLRKNAFSHTKNKKYNLFYDKNWHFWSKITVFAEKGNFWPKKIFVLGHSYFIFCSKFKIFSTNQLHKNIKKWVFWDWNSFLWLSFWKNKILLQFFIKKIGIFEKTVIFCRFLATASRGSRILKNDRWAPPHYFLT